MVKKISAIILALVLCLSVMVVPVSASAPVLTGSQGAGIGFGFFAEDGTTAITSVKAGDKVTVKVYATSATDNDVIQNLGFQLWYNNTVYTYLSETFTWGPEFVTLLDTTLSKAEKITSASGAAYTNVVGAMTTDEAAYGWNEAVQGVPAISSKTWTAKENADKPIAIFQLQVLEGVEDGTVAALGAPAKSTFVKRNAFYNYVQTDTVAKPTNATSAAKLALSNGNGTSFEVKIPACETHTWNNGEVKTNPTCGEDGEMLYTCTVCKTTKNEAINATGNHTAGNPVDEIKTPASCNATGLKDVVVSCTVCGDEISRTEETIPATGEHNYATEVERVEATCEEDGYYVMACGCGERDAATPIPATGHDYDSVVTEPTCTEDGYTTYTCGNCQDTYTADTVTANGHSYDSVVTPPTCTEDGFTTYTCSVCGDTYTGDTVVASGHDYKETVTEPTCTEGGYTTFTCDCGDSYVGNEVAENGHSYEVTFVKKATCAKAGYTEYTCSVCGDSYEEPIPSKNHTNDDGSSAIVEIPAVPATCSATGYTAGAKCTLCNTQTVTPTQVPKAEHSWDEGVVTEPTYTTQGYTTFTCTVCGETKMDDYVPRLEANFSMSIREPSITKIRCKDTIVLHTVIEGGDTSGVKVVWTADNENFTMTDLGDGKLEITSVEDGFTVFTASLVDASGNVVATDTVEMQSKADIWGKIGGFFRALFGSTLYYNY